MERTASPTILSRSNQEEIKNRDEIYVEVRKDAHRKTHDDFVAMSRQNIMACQHKIINVRERLSSLDIGDHGQQEHVQVKQGTGGEKNVNAVQSTKSLKNSKEVGIKRETNRLIKQRSSSFEDPAYLKSKVKVNNVKALNRRNSDTLMWTPFSRYNTESAWPETSQNSPSKEQGSSKRHSKLSVFPRLAIRRNSDPAAQRVPSKARGVEKLSDADSKEMGEMYHGSLFRVLRQSMGGLEARPRSSIGHVWQKSNDVFSDNPTNVQRSPRQPQPPSTPRKLTRSNTVTSHNLNRIHQNHQALVGKQLSRPLSFRNRTTTI